MVELSSQLNDLIKIVKENPKYNITYYAGVWEIRNKKLELMDYQLDIRLMFILELLGLLTFKEYMRSHRPARIYKLSIKDFNKRINKIYDLLEYLKVQLKNINIKSLKQLITLINNDTYKIFATEVSRPESYFEGSKDIKALVCYNKPVMADNFIMSYPYYMASNIYGNQFYYKVLDIYEVLFK